VRCQRRENLRGWQIRSPQHYTSYILAYTLVQDHFLAYQKWKERVRSPWDSATDNTVLRILYHILQDNIRETANGDIISLEIPIFWEFYNKGITEADY